MAHYSRVEKIVIDVPDSDFDAEVAFWQGATGQELTPLRHPGYHGATLPGHDVWLLVQRLEDGVGRIHLDIHTDDVDAEVARLERLGATRVRQVNKWWIMADPAGLPFCVLPDNRGLFNDDTARHWD